MILVVSWYGDAGVNEGRQTGTGQGGLGNTPLSPRQGLINQLFSYAWIE